MSGIIVNDFLLAYIIFNVLFSIILSKENCKNFNSENKFYLPRSFPEDNIINERNFKISSAYEASNNPNEDRLKYKKLNFIKNGYYLAVFDGHGGWHFSNYAETTLDLYFETEYKKLSKINDLYEHSKNHTQIIETSLNNAFARVENDFYAAASKQFSNGNDALVRIGACAIVSIIFDDKILTANLGDSEVILFRNDIGTDLNSQSIIHLSFRHNAAELSEQQKLIEKFPLETDIIICDPTLKYCHVKGMLQPTRSFGDFLLKYNHFNSDIDGPITNFAGPYISSIPEFTLHELKLGDIILLASDGLYDELSYDDLSKEVYEMRKEIKLTSNEGIELASMLLERAIEIAADNVGITKEQLRNINRGVKRGIHDDISIITVTIS